MFKRVSFFALAAILVFWKQTPLLAGMPTVSISQSAAERLSVISFFLVMLVVSTFIIKFGWNMLRRDVPILPKIGWKTGFGIAILWGLLSIVVLTMISGARELMTPGAWKPNGLTYQLAKKEAAEIPEETTIQLFNKQQHLARKEKLILLQNQLLSFAIDHQGNYPTQEEAKTIAEKFWLLPETIGGRYLYFPGKKMKEPQSIIVIEPQITERQFVLFTDGIIAELLPEQVKEIRR